MYTAYKRTPNEIAHSVNGRINFALHFFASPSFQRRLATSRINYYVHIHKLKRFSFVRLQFPAPIPKPNILQHGIRLSRRTMFTSQLSPS